MGFFSFVGMCLLVAIFPSNTCFCCEFWLESTIEGYRGNRVFIRENREDKSKAF